MRPDGGHRPAQHRRLAAVLPQHTPTLRLSAIGWVFSVQALLVFVCGIQIGPLFDAIEPRALVAAGSVLLVVSTMVLGECTAYWHFVLDLSIVNGLEGSLLLTRPLASIGHFFHRRRALATGIAMSWPGSSSRSSFARFAPGRALRGRAGRWG